MGKTSHTEIQVEWTAVVEALKKENMIVKIWIADAALCHRQPAAYLKRKYGITWLPDPPHVLKRIRNWLFTVTNSDKGVPFLGDTFISKHVIELAYLRATGESLTMCPWITYAAIFPDAFAKMRVGFVLRLLDPRFISIVKSLKHPHSEGTALFLEFLQDWWSIFGSRERLSGDKWTDIVLRIEHLNEALDQWETILENYEPDHKCPSPDRELLRDLAKIGELWISEFGPIIERNAKFPGFCFIPGIFTQDINEGSFGRWRSSARGDGNSLTMDQCLTSFNYDVQRNTKSCYVDILDNDDASYLGAGTKGSYIRQKGRQKKNCKNITFIIDPEKERSQNINTIEAQHSRRWIVSDRERSQFASSALTVIPIVNLLPAQLSVALYIAGGVVRSVALMTKLEDFLFYDDQKCHRKVPNLTDKDKIRVHILRAMKQSVQNHAPVIKGVASDIFALVEKKPGSLIRVNAILFWNFFVPVAKCLVAERESGYISVNRRSKLVPMFESLILKQAWSNALELSGLAINQLMFQQFEEISDDMRRRMISFFESKFTGGETIRILNDSVVRISKKKRQEKKKLKKQKLASRSALLLVENTESFQEDRFTLEDDVSAAEPDNITFKKRSLSSDPCTETTSPNLQFTPAKKSRRSTKNASPSVQSFRAELRHRSSPKH